MAQTGMMDNKILKMGLALVIGIILTTIIDQAGGQVKSPPPDVPPVTITNVAAAAGLTHRTIYGGEQRTRYLLETTAR
jgi:hypothetical protein